MRFEWDEAKNLKNIKKHGVDFNDVKEIFNYPMIRSLDTRENYGEDRWIGIGWIATILGVVVYVEKYDDVIRFISARKASKHEVKYYGQRIKN